MLQLDGIIGLVTTGLTGGQSGSLGHIGAICIIGPHPGQLLWPPLAFIDGLVGHNSVAGITGGGTGITGWWPVDPLALPWLLVCGTSLGVNGFVNGW